MISFSLHRFRRVDSTQKHKSKATGTNVVLFYFVLRSGDSNLSFACVSFVAL